MINPKPFALIGLLLLILVSPEAIAQQNSSSLRFITCARPDSIYLQWRTCDSLVLSQPNANDTLIVEYGVQGFARGMGVIDTLFHTPYSFGNLSPTLSYEFHFQKLCGTDSSSVHVHTDSSAGGPLPVAHIIKDSLLLSANATEYYFDGTASQNAMEFFWDFDNGQTSNKPRDTVMYLGAGMYRVSLAVSNPCGVDSDTSITYPLGFIGISLKDNRVAQIQVYPNPANHKVNVSFREVGSGDVEIRLRDAQGREVIFLEDRMESGKFNKDIDVSSLARGMYMVEVRSGDLTAHRRLSIR